MPETMLVATLEPARQVTRMCTGMPATDPAMEEKGLCQPWQTGTGGWRVAGGSISGRGKGR